MGVDYSAHAVIGVKVPREKLWIEQRVKAYDHHYPESMNFNPQTGAKLWETLKEPIPVYFEAEEEIRISSSVFQVFWDHTGENAIVAVCHAYVDAWGSNTCLDFAGLPDIELAKAKLKDALGPEGLWNEKTFGLYAVLRCS